MDVTLIEKNSSFWQLFNPQNTYVLQFKKHSLTLARLCVCLAILCLPYSHFLVNQLTITATIFAIFAGDWKAKWKYVAQFPFLWLSFVILFILILGMFYSEASLGKAASGFTKYDKIIFILFFLPLFRCRYWRNYALHCLIFTFAFAEIISILGRFDLLDISTFIQAHPKVFPQVNYTNNLANIFILLIPFSALSAFVGFLLLHFIFEKKHRMLYLSLFAVNTFHLLFISGERTGLYSFILLSLAFILQRLGLKKGVLLSICVFPFLLFSFYHFVPKFSQKTNLIVTEIKDHQQGNYHTSIGYRLEFMHGSYLLIKENPFFGVGTGGFIPAYQRVGGVVNNGAPFLSDPHNDYIYVFVEIGMIGLSIYLLWLLSLMTFSAKLPIPEQWLAQGLMINFMFNSLTNATLILPPTGFLFILFISILYASYDKDVSWKKMSSY